MTLPRIAPLVLKGGADAINKGAWIFELKYDGFRALLGIDGTGARRHPCR
jgi:ATP-dependent DNA ligase